MTLSLNVSDVHKPLFKQSYNIEIVRTSHVAPITSEENRCPTTSPS
jgi:hypothetical protein